MIYLKLFLTFLKIGAVSFGGGYAMIPLVQESVVNNAWLTVDEILNFIAIAESTPGPIAINMATFVGMSQGGLLGAILATIGVTLPSFVIIILVCVVIGNLLSNSHIKAILNGIKPVITALIIGTAINLFLSVIFAVENFSSIFDFNYFGLIIFAFLALVYFLYYKWKKKPISPIILICISGVIGIILY